MYETCSWFKPGGKNVSVHSVWIVVVVGTVRVSIVVSISACHADDPGSIPGRGNLCMALNAMDSNSRLAMAARGVSLVPMGNRLAPLCPYY